MRLGGCSARIIAIDLVPSKLETARRFGATHGLLGSDPELKQKLRALTNGNGADYVFVTVGAKQASSNPWVWWRDPAAWSSSACRRMA